MKKNLTISNLKWIILTLSIAIFPYHIQAQIPPALQWGFSLDRQQYLTTPGTTSSDWFFKIIRTSDGGYIACGYTLGYNSTNTHPDNNPLIVKLSAAGKLEWQKNYPLNSVTDYDGTYGMFFDIIEVPSQQEYVAVGFKRFNGTNEPRHCIIEIVDYSGNELNTGNNIIPWSNSHIRETANSITQAPNGNFLIAGTGTISSGFEHGIVYRTNGFGTNSQIIDYHNTSGAAFSDAFGRIKFGGGSSGNFDFIVAGNELDKSTRITIPNFSYPTACACTSLANLSSDATLIKNNDILAARYNVTGSTISQVWVKTYDSGGGGTPWPITVNDYGPYTHAHPVGTQLTSPYMDYYYGNTFDDYTADILVSKYQSNTIVLLSKSNFVHLFEGFHYMICCINPVSISGPAISDPNKSTAYADFDEYADGDGFLLNINYTNGNLVNDPPDNIAHFSGADFAPSLSEDNCGNFYVCGSTADDEFSTASQSLGLPSTPITKVDFLAVKTDPSFNRIWAHNYDTDKGTGAGQNYECCFSSYLNPDNSLVMVGNNAENSDDAVAMKIGSDYEPFQTSGLWHFATGHTLSTGETWTSNWAVKGPIIIPSGKTLTIQNCTIEFAETKETEDYNSGSIMPTGIFVEPGGELILDGCTLKGISGDACNPDHMWDGISLAGNATLPPSSAQGLLTMQNSAIVQDAKVGVFVEEKDYFENNSTNINTYDLETWDINYIDWQPSWSGGGGIINARTYSEFLNCRKSIEYWPYGYTNAGYFDDCTFLCNAPMVDDDYYNYYGLKAGNTEFVTMWDVHGLDFFNGTSFTNSVSGLPEDVRGVAIGTLDAGFRVENNCTFTTNTYGIESANLNRTWTVFADQNTFDSNEFGINLNAVDAATITNNTFQLGAAPKANYGVYLETCTGYGIQQNIFNTGFVDHSYGIIDYYPVHPNPNLDEIYNNQFNGLTQAIKCEGELYKTAKPEEGLQLRCNDYRDNDYDEYVDDLYPDLTYNGIAGHQGSSVSPPSSLANNSFDSFGCTNTDGELFNENVSGSLNSFQYHHSQDNAGYYVVPTSGCYTTSSATISAIPYSNFFDKEKDCEDLREFEEGEEMQRLNSENASIDSLEGILADQQIQINDNFQSFLSSDSTFLPDSSQINELANTEEQISFHNSERNRSINKLMRYFLSDTSIVNGNDSAIQLLSNENDDGRRMQLVGLFMQKNDTVNAKIILSSLTDSSWNNFVQLMTLLIPKQGSNGTLFQLKNDSLAMHIINTIANDSLHYGYVQARSIHKLIYGENYPEVIHNSYPGPLRKANVKTNYSPKEIVSLKSYPNPFTHSVIIETEVYNTDENSFIVISDMLGREIQKYKLNEGKELTTIEDGILRPGIYFVTLFNSKDRLASERIVKSE